MMPRGLLLALPFLAACTDFLYGTALQLKARPQRDWNLEPRSVAWRPDGRQLVHVTLDGCLHATDAQTGQVVTLHCTRTPPVTEVRWSQDGERLLAMTGQSVEILDRRGREVLVVQGCLVGEFGQDGRRLALGGWADGRVEIREARTGAIEHVFSHVPKRVSSVSWSPDGGRLAVGAWDQTVRILDVDARDEIARFVVKPTGWVRVSYSPDGKRLAWHGHHSSTWAREIENGAEREIEVRAGTEAIAWSPDARRIAVLGGSSLDVWDVDSMERVTTFPVGAGTDKVLWSPDGLYVAASCFLDRTVVWNVRSGASIQASAYPCAFGPDMSVVAFGARVEAFSRF
jgi:dipeptidyl aminopeptidase/acylaminoacyl peptidase